MIAVITCGHHPEDERVFGREIKSLLSEGYNITYFTRWKTSSNISENNLFHRNYSENKLSIRKYSNSLVNDLKILKPTIIHIHEFELLSLAKKIKKLFNTKIIYDVHEANMELWDISSSKPKVIKYVINKSLNIYERKFLKYVDYVLTTTPELVRRYKSWRVKSIFIPNYPIALSRKIRKAPIQTIIYHGQISFERGLEDLIHAISYLDISKTPCKLFIYGNERESGTINMLNNLILELKLEDVVKIKKQIPHLDMLKVLSQAHIAVIPFRDNPMFQIAIPVKMFEAMWAECAIIASDLKSIRKIGAEFIKFYPPGEVKSLSRAIQKLLVNTQEREDLGKMGAKLIKEKYNWRNVEPDLFDVYKKVSN